jgi:uncharacterized protein YjiS (DUF1127 family)
MRATNMIERRLASFSWVFAVVSRIAGRLRSRRQLMSLLDMPDHLLKDIGLQRHEITREALKRFWEK